MSTILESTCLLSQRLSYSYVYTKQASKQDPTWTTTKSLTRGHTTTTTIDPRSHHYYDH